MSEVITSNNFRRMSWLFTLEDAHLSSVYLRQEIRGEDRVGFVKGRVSEALRMADKIPRKQQVLPYYWFKYQDNRDNFLSEVSLSELLEMFASDTGVKKIYREFMCTERHGEHIQHDRQPRR